MKIYLSLTVTDAFRSPSVLERVREELRDGKTVAVSTRDHPDTIPDGAVHTHDDWNAVAAAEPTLAVLDNLRFEDRRGREFRRWDDDGQRYRTESADFLEDMIRKLGNSGTRELLLVSEDSFISEGWNDWMTLRDVLPLVLYPYAEEGLAACRRWRLLDTPGDSDSCYSYHEGRLLKPADRASPRAFEARVVTPQAEALLALAGEYAAIRFDYANPDDPRQLNARPDMFHRIVEAFAGSTDPMELIAAFEDMYDWVSEHVDFSRTRARRRGNGEFTEHTDRSEKGGNSE